MKIGLHSNDAIFPFVCLSIRAVDPVIVTHVWGFNKTRLYESVMIRDGYDDKSWTSIQEALKYLNF